MQRLPESLHDLSPTARCSRVRLIDRATRVNCLSVEKVHPAAVGDMRPLIFEAILETDPKCRGVGVEARIGSYVRRRPDFTTRCSGRQFDTIISLARRR